MLAMLAIATVMLTGCVGDVGGEESETDLPVPTVNTASSRVQDLWVYNQIQTVGTNGDMVDLTEHILEGLGTPNRSERLPDGASFHIYESLTPSVTSAGNVRSDLSVVAGVIEVDQVRALAALATPKSDAQGSVGLDDSVELDLTFLGELLAPGDPIVTDVIFIQTRPGENESSLEDVALLSERLTNGRAFTYGAQTEQGVRLLPLTGVLGEAVAGSTRMSVPGKGGLPFPDLSGPMGELFCPKIFFGPKEAMKCLEDYFQEMINVAEDTRDLLECNLGGCGGPGNTQELCIGLGCETPTVRADPHILSFDGKPLSMQGVGEYVLSRGTGIEVQMRTAAAGAHRTASAVTMVAIQIGDDQAVIGTDKELGQMAVWVNDVLVPYSIGQGYTQHSRHGTFEVTQTAHEVLIEANDGSKLYVRRTLENWLDLTLRLSGQFTDLAGLLGDNDGDPSNDWRARNGTVLADEAQGRELYTDFSDTWRVTDEDSILRYLPGENTRTFTDLSYPEEIVTLADLSPMERAKAEQLCRLAGIANALLLDQCTLDYALTGEIAFVLSAQYAERDLEIAVANPGSREENIGERGSQALDPAAWALTPSSAEAPVADVFLHTCPPGGLAHAVWGGTDGVYTADSSICTAAVHAGFITIEHGGTVKVTRLAGLEDYGPGSTYNGVTTRDWQRPWPESFRVAQ